MLTQKIVVNQLVNFLYSLASIKVFKYNNDFNNIMLICLKRIINIFKISHVFSEAWANPIRYFQCKIMLR